MSPSARPDELVQILRDTLAADTTAATSSAAATRWPREVPAPLSALPWAAARVARDLDRRYDEEQGGWGAPQKAPISANVEFELLRRSHGDVKAGERARIVRTKPLSRAGSPEVV